MASNPPFQMEDHTDEDFFDKLVNDEDDGNVRLTSNARKDAGPALANAPAGNDPIDSFDEFDDAKAFNNLSIGEDSGGQEIDNILEKEKGPVDASPTLASTPASKDSKEADPTPANAPTSNDRKDAGPALANAPTGNDPIDSLVLDNRVVDSNNHHQGGGRSQAGFNQNLSENIGSNNSGVKEIGWNSLFADSNENGVQGLGSYSDFFSNLGENSIGDFSYGVNETAKTSSLDQNAVSTYQQYQDVNRDQVYGDSTSNSRNESNEQYLNSSQYWENMYPGWKYDANSGQWYQLDGFGGDGSGNTNVKSGASYLQQTVHSIGGTMITEENGATESVANWNQVSQVNNGYPEHMYFDPQFPGWYWNLITQQWCALESYDASFQSSVQGDGQQYQNGFASTGQNSQTECNNYNMYGEHGQGDNYGSLGHGSPGEHHNWRDSYGNYNNPGLNMWQPSTVPETETVSSFTGKQQSDTSFGLSLPVNKHANGVTGLHTFLRSENFNQQFTQTNLKQNEQMHFSNDFYGGQKPVNVAQQPLQSSESFPYASNNGRSSDGRPPHALVCFGFGGKLIVLKDNNPLQNSSFGTQDSVGGSISVLNLLEILNSNTFVSGAPPAASNYFNTLCQQSFPGPLVGGNVGSKDLHKWIDDRIASCESSNMDYKKGENLRILLSLLKIACQHYGKLRSPFGSDSLLKGTDTPESAVARLFTSAKRKDRPYGALSHCLQRFPSEGQIQATAFEVQNLLVSGRKKEALQRAQEGQLWGPALVLASQLGEQFYIDTVKQMALNQLVAGSPLRTLCLLIAGQPAEVFSTDSTVDSMDLSQQHVQLRANWMLDDWEENLAVITTNRTKDDGLVTVHLGDCLWKERSEITAAHICYLVAEANFESYSGSARLCLIGADHWKFPRTYASPEAIQRTELYEYSKVLGNSQFVLLPFQPYKLIYAQMLAEVGKVSDSLKYCQAILKSLKTSRVPEVETWKHLILSLEERIRFHQQRGYATNLAPTKLVGKLLNFFDSTAHRVVGGLPPPHPSTPNENSQGNGHFNQQTGPRVSASQSTTALMPSSSMEPINDWAGEGTDRKMTIHNRSVSEPDIGRTRQVVDSPKEAQAQAPTEQAKESGSVVTSRFSGFSFGSQLFQKTVALVLRPRSDKQAKLGEKNKFYYDEKLKRWVEEGAEPPAEETALPPPPTTTAFQNGTSDKNLNSALKSEGSPPNRSPRLKNPTPIEHASGIPPVPTSPNQYSARGRMGVRARYVDTFNKGGGGQANLFQSPAISSVKPAKAANAKKFFVPAPISTQTSEQIMESITENSLEEHAASSNPTTPTSTPNANESCPSPKPPLSKTRHRFPSMDNLPQDGNMLKVNGNPPRSRRTASWSGDIFVNPLSPPSPMNGGSFGDGISA